MDDPLPLAWITGAGGLIGNYLVQSSPRYAIGWGVAPITRDKLDLTDFAAVRRMIHLQKPNLVIHCGALAATQSAH